MVPPVLERLYGISEVRNLEDTILWLTRNTAVAASLVSMIKDHCLPPPPPRPARPLHLTSARSACLVIRHALQAAVLSQHGDPPEYAHGLLHATHVVVHPAAPPLRADMSLRQEFTQAEVLCRQRLLRVRHCFHAHRKASCTPSVQVVTRVIDSMVRVTSRGGTNVLCYGFRKVRRLCSREIASHG